MKQPQHGTVNRNGEHPHLHLQPSLWYYAALAAARQVGCSSKCVLGKRQYVDPDLQVVHTLLSTKSVSDDAKILKL